MKLLKAAGLAAVGLAGVAAQDPPNDVAGWIALDCNNEFWNFVDAYEYPSRDEDTTQGASLLNSEFNMGATDKELGLLKRKVQNCFVTRHSEDMVAEHEANRVAKVNAHSSRADVKSARVAVKGARDQIKADKAAARDLAQGLRDDVLAARAIEIGEENSARQQAKADAQAARDVVLAARADAVAANVDARNSAQADRDSILAARVIEIAEENAARQQEKADEQDARDAVLAARQESRAAAREARLTALNNHHLARGDGKGVPDDVDAAQSNSGFSFGFSSGTSSGGSSVGFGRK